MREPRNQHEIDRNLFFLGWILILPSTALLFGYHGGLLALLLVGGLTRLLHAAIRLPRNELGFWWWPFAGFPMLFGLLAHLDFLAPWCLLLPFWVLLIYSDQNLFRYRREKSLPPKT